MKQLPAIHQQVTTFKKLFLDNIDERASGIMIFKRSGVSNVAIIGAVVVVIIVIAGVSLIALPSMTKKPTSSTTSQSTVSSTSSSKATTTSSSTTSSTVQSTASSTTSISSSSSVGITTTLSCPTSTTTQSSAQSLNLAPLFGNFTAMSGYLYELRGAQSATIDSNYTVLVANATTFKVSISSNVTGSTVVTMASLLRNGTVVSASQAGYNFSGSQAEKLLLESMDPFILEVSQNTLTPNPAEMEATVANHSTIMLGPTNVTVSNYASNSLPVTITQCTTTQTIAKFQYQTGSATGATFPLLTVFNVDAYQIVSGQHYPINVVFRLTSVTVS